MDVTALWPQEPLAAHLTPSTAVNVIATDTGGYFCGAEIVNADAATRYLQVFAADATDVTLGTTVPVAVYPIPSSGVGGGVRSIDLLRPIQCAGGMSVAITTTPTGATAGSASNTTVYYK